MANPIKGERGNWFASKVQKESCSSNVKEAQDTKEGSGLRTFAGDTYGPLNNQAIEGLVNADSYIIGGTGVRGLVRGLREGIADVVKVNLGQLTCLKAWKS